MIGTPRNSAISSVRARCALPEKILSCPRAIVTGNAPVVIKQVPLSAWLPFGALRATLRLVEGLGRVDSNHRIRDPKSRALPLGHAPGTWKYSVSPLGQSAKGQV